MGSEVKYSLWLRPFGDIAFSLQQRIQKLSEKYDAPSFEPHITLLGSLKDGETELVQLTETLASSLHPFDVLLTKAGVGNTFYQSLFVHVEESRELMNARKTAEKLFNPVDSDDRYLPHLSLMYGEFSREQKERILNSMGREFHIRFPVHSLLLVRTDGRPGSWKKIHSAEFTKPTS